MPSISNASDGDAENGLVSGVSGIIPSSADMGNAFQVLQVLVQPRVQYVIEEKLDEEADEDDSGGPDDPIRHLRRQAAKIRRGEKLERLTVPKR